MNVLFLSSDYPPNLLGGVGTYTDQFARHLVKRRHQAFVITRTAQTPLEYVEQGVRVWRVRPRRLSWLDPARDRWPELIRRIEYSMAVAWQMRQVLRRHRIDLIESCESRAEGCWYFLFHRQPQLVVKLHTPDGFIFTLNQEPESSDRRLVLLLEEWWLRRATKLVGLTKAMTAKVGRLYQLPTSNIPIVRVPVESDFFVPDAAARADGRRQVLYVGRLEFRKGVHVLLRALPAILHAVPGAHVLFIGRDCGMQRFLDGYRQDSQYRDHITWRESVSREELRTAYQQSQVCVVPSLWENHPAVCLEAMSCGCAVVASRAGGIPELIQHNVNGTLVPPGSSRELARAVVELLTHPDACQRVGRQARQEIERRYTIERVFDETITLYERLLSNGHGHVVT